MSIPVTGIGHVLLHVRDLARSRHFYTDVLGFTIVEEDPEHGGTFMSIGAGTHVVDLHQIDNPGEAPEPRSATDADAEKASTTPGLGHVGFPLPSADALRDGYFELVDHDVHIVAALDHGSQQSVYFLDPDEHMLEIYWERPNARELFAAGRHDADDELVFVRP